MNRKVNLRLQSLQQTPFVIMTNPADRGWLDERMRNVQVVSLVSRRRKWWCFFKCPRHATKGNKRRENKTKGRRIINTAIRNPFHSLFSFSFFSTSFLGNYIYKKSSERKTFLGWRKERKRKQQRRDWLFRRKKAGLDIQMNLQFRRLGRWVDFLLASWIKRVSAEKKRERERESEKILFVLCLCVTLGCLN